MRWPICAAAAPATLDKLQYNMPLEDDDLRCRQSEGNSSTTCCHGIVMFSRGPTPAFADARAQCSQHRARAPQALLSYPDPAGIPAAGQTIWQRRSSTAVVFFPQDTPNDSTNLVGDLLVREATATHALVSVAGGLGTRANTHYRRRRRLDILDPGIQRPRLSVRRLMATVTRGKFTLDPASGSSAGESRHRQSVDRFAPATHRRRGRRVSGGDRCATPQAADETRGSRFRDSRRPDAALSQRWAAVHRRRRRADRRRGHDVPDGSQAGVR